MRWMLTLTLMLALSTGLLACGGESEEPASEGADEAAETAEAEATETETDTEAEPEPAETAEAEPAVPRATDGTFVLEARPEEGGYTANTLGQFAIHLEGEGEWHLNQDFPFSIELSGPEGIQFPKASLGKDDAAEFADELARFDVPFTPGAAGEHEVRATVSFAVCNPQSCVPKTQTIALNIPVS